MHLEREKHLILYMEWCKVAVTQENNKTAFLVEYLFIWLPVC